MKIGFTGTREGIDWNRVYTLRILLEELHPIEVHHGGCWGADLQFHEIANIGFIKRHVHPGPKSSHEGEFIYKTKPYLERNQDIVDACDLLIACPKERQEILRSGTWATIRYARKTGKPRIILLP